MPMTISAVILAGGKSRRMQGQDKGLQLLNGKPLFLHCYNQLKPQVKQISINANRHLEEYKKSGLEVFSDILDDYQGPLSGILTALKKSQTEMVLFVPCDCPKIPLNLKEKLLREIKTDSNLLISYAHDGERDHPTFCLISTKIIPDLEIYLQKGKRKMLDFIHSQPHIVADFSDEKLTFQNINTLAELQKLNNHL